jgi:putative membrane protein
VEIMGRKFLLRASAVAAALLTATFAAGQTTDQTPSSTTHKSHSSMQTGTTASTTGALSAADKNFVMKAAKGGLAEVELGRLAAEKATNPDVKQFGQRMVDDHSKANDELKSLAEQKGITLPTELDAKDKATRDRLAKLSGEAFDRAYMTDMVKDHKMDVSEFRKESRSARDADVKAFAGKTLPTLEEHLKMAEDDHAKVAGARASSKTKKTSS